MADPAEDHTKATDFERGMLHGRVSALEGRTDRIEAVLLSMPGKMDDLSGKIADLRTAVATSDGIRKHATTVTTICIAAIAAVGSCGAGIVYLLRLMAH